MKISCDLATFASRWHGTSAIRCSYLFLAIATVTISFPWRPITREYFSFCGETINDATGCSLAIVADTLKHGLFRIGLTSAACLAAEVEMDPNAIIAARAIPKVRLFEKGSPEAVINNEIAAIKQGLLRHNVKQLSLLSILLDFRTREDIASSNSVTFDSVLVRPGDAINDFKKRFDPPARSRAASESQKGVLVAIVDGPNHQLHSREVSVQEQSQSAIIRLTFLCDGPASSSIKVISRIVAIHGDGSVKVQCECK